MIRYVILLVLVLSSIGVAALVEGTNCGFVTVAPTADPGATGGVIDGYSLSARFTSPAGATKVTEIGWWCDTATEESNWEAGIYDNDGSPNNLLAGESRTNAKGTTAGWKSATGLNITISGSTTYWLGVQLDNTTTQTNVDYALNASYSREYASASATLPNPWNGGSAAGRIMAIYALYETGSPPPSQTGHHGALLCGNHRRRS